MTPALKILSIPARLPGILALGILLCLAPLARAQAPALQPNSGRDCAACHIEWSEAYNQPRAILLLEKPSKSLVADPETCLGCHDGAVGDSRREVWVDHSHKTGISPPAGMTVPKNLPLEDGKLACRTCHTAHSAVANTIKDVFFLRVKNDDGQLCTSCHTNKSNGPAQGMHPLVAMKAQIPKSLLDAGSHAGPNNDKVVCQSCHTAHGSKTDSLLVLATNSSQLCITCHEQVRPGMFRAGAPHDHPQNPPLSSPAQATAIRAMGTKIGADNTLICLSCHKMHGGLPGKAMLADTLKESQLCIRCHEDRRSMANTVHDLRKSAPQELNAQKQTADQSGPCGACHSFHSYARDRKPANGDPLGLCTTCHSEGQIASKHTGQPFSHPGEIDAARVPAGTKLTLFPSPTDPKKKSVMCLSCHNPHDASHPHFLRTQGDQLCASCHEQKVQQMAGKHDFSTRADLKNGKDHTGQETGKCGFCHAVHNANGPTMWVATKNPPKDPAQLCTECHREAGLAKEKPLAKFNHPAATFTKPDETGRVAAGHSARPKDLSLPLYTPDFQRTPEGAVACGSCHDIHASPKDHKNLVRTTGEVATLCTTCHTDKAKMKGTQHDFNVASIEWPQNAEKPGDLCMSCHKPHSNDETRKRWAVVPRADAMGNDGACAGCHGDQYWNLDPKQPLVPRNMIHPRATLTGDQIALLPGARVTDQKQMLCATCHDPHSAPTAKSFLRIAADAPTQTLCLSCHENARPISHGMHAPDAMAAVKGQTGACGPCHDTHALKSSSRVRLTAAPLDPKANTTIEALCLGCHSESSKFPNQKKVFYAPHGRADFKSITTAATQPVVKGDRVLPASRPANFAVVEQVTCATCHVTHGHYLEGETPDSAPLPLAQRSAAKPMLKPNVDRDLCALCHGFDASRVYLYFHNANKRADAQRLLHPQGK